MRDLLIRDWFSMIFVLISAGACLVHFVEPCNIRVLRVDHLVLAILVMCAFVFMAVLFLGQIQTPGWRRWALGPLVLVSSLSWIVLTAFYTDLGIVVLGGDHYWVTRAAKATSPGEQECLLGVALQGTQYAVNTVEAQVLTDYSQQPELQALLFGALSRVAPNEGWAKRYLARREAALEAVSQDARSRQE